MTVIERHEARLQARLDKANAELIEDERMYARLAALNSRRLLIFEERPQYAVPIVIMTAEELARL